MEFEDIEYLYQTERFDEALAELKCLHSDWHDRPSEHTLIHLWQARIAMRQRHYRHVVWELFAMVFAAPTSLVQKYLGLVRKNI